MAAIGETSTALAFGPLMLRRKSARLDDGAAEVLLLSLVLAGWLAGVQVACCAVALLGSLRLVYVMEPPSPPLLAAYLRAPLASSSRETLP